MSFREPRTLGRTGLKVGRLGISSSFGAPVAAFEDAFEKGCNYFTWGTFLRRRSASMCHAIRNIVSRGGRDQLVIGMLTYAHHAFLTERFLRKGLKAASIDYADVLLLGWFPRRPSQKIIDGALALKEKGLIRHIGLTSHNRRLFSELAKEEIFDVFHIRYNAAHRGAETETFPLLDSVRRPGIVAFTATDWQKLLKTAKMPPGEPPLTAAECYRFVLSHPMVDVCMMGARTASQMTENLEVLKTAPLTGEEMARLRRIGDYVYGRRFI